METTPELKKPTIPADWYRKSTLGTALFLGYATALYLGCAVGLAWIFTRSGWPLGLRLIASVPTLLLGAQGLHLYGWIGHEGFHFNLHRNRLVSVGLGVAFASAIIGFMQIGVSVSHWNHHRRTNLEGDPDADLFGQFPTLLGRLFALRPAGNRIYIQNTIALIKRRPLARYRDTFPLSPEVARRFAILNVALSMAWLAVYLWLLFIWPAFTLAVIAIHVVTGMYSGLRAYAEHSGTRAGTFVDSRSRPSVIFTLLNFGNNFHLAHHLYPSVPCYRLGKVHRLLEEQGLLARAGSPVDRSVRAVLAHAAGPYPAASREAGPETDPRELAPSMAFE